MTARRASIAERLEASSMPEPNSGCVLWLGYILPTGYGHVAGKYAHRAAYEVFVGPIPDGLQIDHLCRNRACINPRHLEAVTQKTNLLRGMGWAGINARRTHCLNGHAFDASNTGGRNRPGRECLACKNERGQIRNQQRREQRAEHRRLHGPINPATGRRWGTRPPEQRQTVEAVS